MTATKPEIALARILQAIEAELIEATEEEIAAALSDLGINPSLQGSAALIDLKYPTIRRHLERLYGLAPAEADTDADEDASIPHLPRAPRHDR